LRIALDTTVLIDALRGREAADRIRELHARRVDPPWICAINVEELHRGIRPSEVGALESLLRHLQIAPLGIEQGRLAGNWRRDYATRGITLSQADCLIAAAAIGVGATLATGNIKDFPMSELALEHWPSGA
jgi:predicted nucleic acid-binding protein